MAMPNSAVALRTSSQDETTGPSLSLPEGIALFESHVEDIFGNHLTAHRSRQFLRLDLPLVAFGLSNLQPLSAHQSDRQFVGVRHVFVEARFDAVRRFNDFRAVRLTDPVPSLFGNDCP